MCEVCKWGEDFHGNEILLCDTPDCSRAYHLKCLKNPLPTVPAGDWFCPVCEPEEDEAEPFELSSPSAKRSLCRELQRVDGVDLMGWAREQAGLPPPPPWPKEALRWTAETLCGRPCLYAATADASMRAGVVIDLRLANPSKVRLRPAVCPSSPSALCRRSLPQRPQKAPCPHSPPHRPQTPPPPPPLPQRPRPLGVPS